MDTTVNLWVTSPGVANNMHYDASWNYLVGDMPSLNNTHPQ
jgi:hypothetical protein